MSHLKTTEAVIEALGDLKAVAQLTGRGYTAAHNWKTRGKFPADTYEVMQRELAKLRHSAPSSLWRQTTAQKRNGT